MKKAYLFILTILLVCIAISCSDYYINNVERGGGYDYVYGHPELRIVTAGFYNNDGTPIIDISGDIIYGGLVYFRNHQNKMQADILINISITNQESKEVVAQKSISDSLVNDNEGIIHSQEVYRFNEKFTASPGTFDVEVILTDQRSGRQTVRTSTTGIPDTEESVVSISEIQILGKDNALEQAEFVPVTTYDVPGNLDSLKFIVQITNSTGRSIKIDSRLKKFRSDTAIAWPMSIQDYPRSSLMFQGIEYDEFEIVQSGTRTIEQNGNIFIEFSYEQLGMGNYRLEISITEQEEGTIVAGREFGMKPHYYPAIKTTYKMAEALRYIMKDEEYEALMALKDQDAMRNAMDRFWLENIKNSAIAKEVISLYYNRVEEANKQFSNFKEGWKTDPGMVYVLFGPPWSVNDVLNTRMVWSYTNNMDDSERNFLFRASEIKSRFFPFDNYILDRDILYHTLEYKQIQRWRTGSILTVDL